MEKELINITLHKVSEESDCPKCDLCGESVPVPMNSPNKKDTAIDRTGYFGVVKGLASGSVSVYRVGSNNKDSLCNGTASTEFFQESQGKLGAAV